MLTRIALLAGLVALAAGCAPIQFGEQELTLRHDAQADALDLLIVYDAIQASSASQEHNGLAREFATRVSGGRRELLIYDWPLHFDLDQIQTDVEGEVEREGDAQQAWGREAVKGFRSVTTASSGYFQGELGRPGLYQHLRIDGAAHWVAMFERALYVAIEDALAHGSFERDFNLLDARSRELWIAMAKDKRGWLSLKDGVLTVDLPATSECAGRVLGDFMKAAAADPSVTSFFAGLASHLTELSIADEHVVLRWKLAGPTITFARSKIREYDDGLAASLRESKALPDTLPWRREVVERFSKR